MSISMLSMLAFLDVKVWMRYDSDMLCYIYILSRKFGINRTDTWVKD